MNYHACQSTQTATQKGGAGSRGMSSASRAEAVWGRGYRTKYSYDVVSRLTSVRRGGVDAETIVYGPDGELVSRRAGDQWIYYIGEYATVSGTCVGTCTPSATALDMDAHVVYGGTRIASGKWKRSNGVPTGNPAGRMLYYFRTRMGSVVATSTSTLSGTASNPVVTRGLVGAKYQYTPYGEVDAALTTGDSGDSRAELGYTNAVRLTGSLLFLKARVYDAAARVFLQADSVDRLRYAYVSGDPINFSDPSGMRQMSDHQAQRGVSFNSIDSKVDWGSGSSITYPSVEPTNGNTPPTPAASPNESGKENPAPLSSLQLELPKLPSNLPSNVAALEAYSASLAAASNAFGQPDSGLESSGDTLQAPPPLLWPLAGGLVGSQFLAPRASGPHRGLDVPPAIRADRVEAVDYTLVYAPQAGTVGRGPGPKGESQVIIQGEWGVRVGIAHVVSTVPEGATVLRGEVVGYIEFPSGESTAPHVHISVRPFQGSPFADPLPFFVPSVP